MTYHCKRTLKKVEKITRPFRYDLNQIPYNYTVEVTNRFKVLDLNGQVIFPAFFNLSLSLSIRSSRFEPQSAPGLVFADCIELPSLAAKNIINLILVLTIW